MKSAPPSIPHILLVDDNCDGLLVRRSLLEEAGCTVQLARSGEEALRLFQATKFDLIVTDFRMPGMDGVEVIRHIRAVEPNARVILLSGFVEPLGLNEENTGADAVIAKSSHEPGNLARAVKRLLNRTWRKPPSSQKRSHPRAGATVVGG
jgi:CheY-like chemotaxis protein